MNQNEVNDELRSIIRDWRDSDRIQKQLLKSGKDKFSDVFVPGITEYYADDANAKGRRILLYGQEARNFYFNANNSVEDIQGWVINYALCQVYQTDCDESKAKWNASPFWTFFRKIKRHGWHPVWSNLDKFHRVDLINKKTKSLTIGEEVVFNSPVKEGEKTIVQKEIDVLKPDLIVFLVGPHYIDSLCTALKIEKDQLAAIKPSASAENYCVQISGALTKLSMPVYWTYHPAFINYSKSKGMSYDDLIRHIIH